MSDRDVFSGAAAGSDSVFAVLESGSICLYSLIPATWPVPLSGSACISSRVAGLGLKATSDPSAVVASCKMLDSRSRVAQSTPSSLCQVGCCLCLLDSFG